MTIRLAEPKDLQELKDLLIQVNNVHAEGRPDIFIKDCRKYNDSEILNLIADQNTRIFCFTNENDKTLGYAFCLIQESKGNNLVYHKTLYIDDICVDENHRRQHIASSLLNFVENWAKENGFFNITLNVWECNPGAKVFYEKMGLKPLKTGMEKIL